MKGIRTLLFAAVSALTLLATSALAQDASDTARELPNFLRVNERLYRGGQPTEEGLRRLAAMGVRTVVNLRARDEHARREGEQARALGLSYFNLPVERIGRPRAERVAEVLAVVNAPENQPVFVHCQRGSDRTGTIVAAYRVAHDGWTAAEATREARRHGLRFWQRGMRDFVHDYERDLRGTRATAPATAATADAIHQHEHESVARRALHQSERLAHYLHRRVLLPVLR
jgi:tyrosine-protein phosphatase SIW14